jgi:hypothetical protein
MRPTKACADLIWQLGGQRDADSITEASQT